MSNIFGANLKSLRKAAKLTQDELALRAWPDKGLPSSRVAISKYERGELVPRTPAQEDLARALGCRVGDFWAEPVETAQVPDATPTPAPSGDPADMLERPEQFDAWARDQILELARRAMAQMRALVTERDQIKEEAAVLRQEVDRLRLELGRLINQNNDLRNRLGLLEGTMAPSVRDSAAVPQIQDPAGKTPEGQGDG